MGIRLPGIDGIEALRQLRAEPTTQGIPVMAMTASVMSEDRQRIMSAGVDAYQGKPVAGSSPSNELGLSLGVVPLAVELG
jgi:two-component system cell cycle response regulator DivK